MYEYLPMSDKQIYVTFSDHLVAERVEMRREGRIMEQREKGERGGEGKNGGKGGTTILGYSGKAGIVDSSGMGGEGCGPIMSNQI